MAKGFVAGAFAPQNIIPSLGSNIFANSVLESKEGDNGKPSSRNEPQRVGDSGMIVWILVTVQNTSGVSQYWERYYLDLSQGSVRRTTAADYD